MKKFDLNEAKGGRPICTADGYPVEILKWDAEGNLPLIGYIKVPDEDEVKACAWNEDGRVYEKGFCDNDLRMASTEYEGWIPLFKNTEENTEKTFMSVFGGKIYNNITDANLDGYKASNFIGSARIKWEDMTEFLKK